MNEAARRTISLVAIRTLEELAFTFSREVEHGPAYEEKVIFATTGYRGSQQGRLALIARPEFGYSLADNLLDLRGSDGAGRQYGNSAVAEFLHIICGMFVAESLSPDADVNLAIAQAIVVPLAAAEAATKTAAEHVMLLTDDNWRLDLFTWM